MRAIDLTGQRFGLLTVDGRAETIRGVSGQSRTSWHCRCDCGKSLTIRTSTLKGRQRSCGCEGRERFRQAVIARNTVHGHNRVGHKSPTHNSWQSMYMRCMVPTHVSYPEYGGRGITICDRWKLFENFLADMGERPEGKTLDRIDVNGNYEKSNCKWSTRSEQQRNKRPFKWKKDRS